MVELSRVSAQMRRDEAAISDRSDERIRERFTDRRRRRHRPAHVAKQWYVRRLRLRHQVSAPDGRPLGEPGPQAAHGRTRGSPGARNRPRCSGSARAAASWTGAAGPTGPRSTGPGAATGRHPDEHTRNVALTRTLTTQGAVIRLPLSVTLGDRFAVPSLAAALLLGLHEQIGGSPDHIDDRPDQRAGPDRDGAPQKG